MCRVLVTPEEIESLFRGTKMIDLFEKFEKDGKAPDGIEKGLKTFQLALDVIRDAISYASIIKQLYERLSWNGQKGGNTWLQKSAKERVNKVRKEKNSDFF